MNAEEFQQVIHTLPGNPGIYKYFDKKKELLYVGKAKNLRKRISSYFNKDLKDYKTYELVQRIHHIETTIVDSETDAFLLENSLIKQFQPKFNINLKDDKSYPYIIITKEDFPRVFLTRKKIHDGSEYLGPYTSVGKVRELLDFIRQNIQLRTCKLNLTPQNVKRGKFKVCLEYHLGNCKGPCEGLQTPEDYAEGLVQLKNMLKGNLSPVIQHFRKEMKEAAEGLKFEKADALRKKIEHIQQYQSRSAIVNDKLGNIDVFSMVKEGDDVYLNYLTVEHGTIVQTQTVTLQKKLEEPDAEVMAFGIATLRSTFNSEANEIIVPFPIEYPDNLVTVTVPKAGDKKKLLDLSQKNADYFLEEVKKKKMLQLENASSQEKMEILFQMQQDLQLSEVPVHIECFDNSNFQGSFPVSAMVCFRSGAPSKKDYRHFNVKTVKGINDFATMKEVVSRRYFRLVRENAPLPQLVIIDGGKGQLSAALEAIDELGITGKMTVVGLAKNIEEIFFPGDKESLKLPWDSSSLKLIRQIRDEVHRFGISFHRKKRSAGVFKNELESIEGIGKGTADTLLKQFKSVKNVSEVSEEELIHAVGKARAGLIWSHFHPASGQAPQT